MKMPISTMLLAGVVLALGIFCLWPLLAHPWVFIKYIEVDLNSGDLRTQVHVFALAVKTEIEESNLSREVRRLGLDVPAARIWKRAFEGRLVSGTHVDYSYGRVVATCGQLLSILDLAKAPDGERRVALEALMTSLRTGNPREPQEQAYLLMDEIADKHGMDVLDPDFKKYPKELRQERQAQQAVP